VQVPIFSDGLMVKTGSDRWFSFLQLAASTSIAVAAIITNCCFIGLNFSFIKE
jgi:hypothetical protein